MNFIHHRQLTDQDRGKLPLTSLIDVVFLLLIFFLVTASSTPRESDLASTLQSEQAGGGRAADLQPQIISVVMLDGSPTYTLGQRRITTQRELTTVLAQLPKEGGVFLKVAPEPPIWFTTAGIQACKDAGFTKVTYVPTS